MISSSRGADYTPKQEEKTSEGGKISKASSSSTSWSRLKDPRIVRVSRAFGGKDRHSKVCTVRGLRDRRVRLSVPTAIQLYDLQDRLGLNQPSKVVDWLLNAAKHDIDELPPLQMPPGNFSQFHQPMVSASNSCRSSADKSEGQINWNDHLGLSTSNFWSNSDENLRPDHMKSKEIAEETAAGNKESWTKGKRDADLEHGAYTSTNNFFTRGNHQPNPSTGWLNNNLIPIQNPSFLRWDSSNLSLSHTEDHLHHNLNVLPAILPSTSLSMPSGSQFVVYPHLGEYDLKQNSPFSNPPFTSPLYTSQATRQFHLSMNPYSGGEPNKDN